MSNDSDNDNTVFVPKMMLMRNTYEVKNKLRLTTAILLIPSRNFTMSTVKMKIAKSWNEKGGKGAVRQGELRDSKPCFIIHEMEKIPLMALSLCLTPPLMPKSDWLIGPWKYWQDREDRGLRGKLVFLNMIKETTLGDEGRRSEWRWTDEHQWGMWALKPSL